MFAIKHVAVLVIVWQIVVTYSMIPTRHKRQLQNKYLGLGDNVEILPAGDNSGVSSSYSVVETSKSPRKEYNTYRSATRNYHQDSEPENIEYQTENRRPSRARDEQKSFRFPENRLAQSKKSSETFKYDDELDTVLQSSPPQKRPTLTPANRKKYKSKKPSFTELQEEKVDESKAAPKNIKEIVEERPAESKLSEDLNNEGSRIIGHGASGYGTGEDFEKDKHYEKEAGQKFLEGHKSEEGEKAEKAFKNEEAYDKGEKEDFGSDEKHSHVAEKAGEKKGHIDEGKHYGEAYQGNHGEKGISVTKKGGHKKGKKTSGFHKVHHKDEYKKDEVFYDESHDGGEHEEHKHEQEKHAKEKGGHEKKGHTDTAYHESHGAKKAESDHGKKYEQAKGHKSEAGEQAHHGQHSEYAKKGGHKEGEKYGHSDAGGANHYEKEGYF
ncbi:glutamic acid-rich protein-like [Daktulosphaira vitifoliae]|uniref:glutamic acid-rich protein-like n=1 Tax=Daktulosphaira vitifoliae TaxID=58002 RepID=UPI0021AA7F29|nr:glutamic acid-rich protein-like [Daktulosphaira vitifoliae]